ncbi:iron-sulfur cluster insertion protein ErpA [Bartonella sp. DGB1]|uniref:iron-sulfur cluster insertion protein ErpA n=1 Tax=Bartonella sp. DGB1 TaxID=3239807 RepID=UPI0035255985
MSITITDAAAKQILLILAKNPAKSALRIKVEGGGCSGFSYKYQLEEKATEDDIIIAKNNATIVIDPISLPFLQGSEVDFINDLMGKYFQINNPNSSSACGCGVSFSI